MKTAAVEEEQRGFDRHFDAPMMELNPAINAFQNLTIRKWDEHLEAEARASRVAARRRHALREDPDEDGRGYDVAIIGGGPATQLPWRSLRGAHVAVLERTRARHPPRRRMAPPTGSRDSGRARVSLVQRGPDRTRVRRLARRRLAPHRASYPTGRVGASLHTSCSWQNSGRASFRTGPSTTSTVRA
jgi:hypothetical protein